MGSVTTFTWLAAAALTTMLLEVFERQPVALNMIVLVCAIE